MRKCIRLCRGSHSIFTGLQWIIILQFSLTIPLLLDQSVLQSVVQPLLLDCLRGLDGSPSLVDLMLICYYLRSPRSCGDLEDFHSRVYIVRGVQGYLRVMLLLLFLFCFVLFSRIVSSRRWYFWCIWSSKRTLKRLSFCFLVIFCERVWIVVERVIILLFFITRVISFQVFRPLSGISHEAYVVVTGNTVVFHGWRLSSLRPALRPRGFKMIRLLLIFSQ